MHFDTENTLKNNHNYILKQLLIRQIYIITFNQQPPKNRFITYNNII